MLGKKNKQVVNIEGMKCEHCAKTVEEKIGKIEGVSKVKVDLKKKCAIITSSSLIKKEEVEASLEDTNFKVG